MRGVAAVAFGCVLLSGGGAAFAQRAGPPAPRPSLDRGVAADIHDNYRRIDRAQDGGRLSRREARRARGENGVTADLAERYARDGWLSPSEKAELDTRSAVMRSILDAPGRLRTRR